MNILLQKPLLSCCFFLLAVTGFAQADVVKEIKRINTPDVALAPLRFLASDELKGRATTRPEINIAARYISESFRSFGLKECPNTSNYFQNFTITMVHPSQSGTIAIGDKVYHIGDDLLQMSGGNSGQTFPLVSTQSLKGADLDKIGVKGKMVLMNLKDSSAANFMQQFRKMREMEERLRNKGAAGLIAITGNDVPWDRLKARFTEDHVQEKEDNFLLFLVKENDQQIEQKLKDAATVAVSISGQRTDAIPARNVMGYVEGTDPKLKNQFVVLTAHYDHLGVTREAKMEDGKLDSIYNGARDNAIGTTAVIDAARYFSQHPAKRSVLCIAYAAEEIGEIGSSYFSEHPVIPLQQLVYNLNIDNASYNDTTIISVIGLGRTSADKDIEKACAAFGLKAAPDPAPEQNLFDRSDNTHLAIKGIPAPTFSLGIKQFDAEIEKRYHQLSDEVGNFNLSYGLKYIQSFVLAAKNIADNPVQPTWKAGDKYEKAWKELYKK